MNIILKISILCYIIKSVKNKKRMFSTNEKKIIIIKDATIMNVNRESLRERNIN